MRDLNIKKQARPDTPLADSPTPQEIQPNYSNMVTKKGFFKKREYIPTSQDTANYKSGFERATKGLSAIRAVSKIHSAGTASEQAIAGAQEATKRGLTPRKKSK